MPALVFSGSGGGFSFNDYNYDNDNSNVRAHLFTYYQYKPCLLAENYKLNQGFGSASEKDLFKQGLMKRHGNLYQDIISIENLMLADQLAQKGKLRQPAVIAHNANRVANIAALHKTLKANEFKTSEYAIFKIYEPKERIVYRLPYYPDRIVHHAIMNILEPIFVASFTADTYSCIKGRGLHSAAKKLKAILKDKVASPYCLKLDIKKFYPSVDHDTLKCMLRRKFKDTDLLNLLDEIIDSADGLPIGNYLSQYFANFYLSGLDHWIKEVKQVKYYFRYADDIVILGNDKAALNILLSDIKAYLFGLKLEVKGNWQIFPVADRGIDFLGCRFYHTHTLLRKSIKKNFARKVKKGANKQTIASYLGWAKHADTTHLIKRLLKDEII